MAGTRTKHKSCVVIESCYGRQAIDNYLNGPFGSLRGTSIESRASNRQGPFHQGHILLSTLVFMFEPTRADIGRN